MAWDKVSMKNAVSSFLVSNEDGSFDLEASVLKFRETALRFVANTETEDTVVLDTISALFDQYKGAKLNMSFIKSQAVARMAADHPEMSSPSLFTMLSKRVEDVLHSVTGEGKAYGVTKGKGGGFYRLVDQAPVVGV